MQFIKSPRCFAMAMVILLAGICAYGQVNGPSTPVQKAEGGRTHAPQKVLAASFVPDNKLPEIQPPSRVTDLQTVVLLTGVAVFVILLLAGGLVFTLREFKRLSVKGSGCSMPVNTIHRGRTEEATASFLRAA